jgi:hypothetical protein
MSFLVLEAIKPTLMITGSGGEGTAANTITFNFSDTEINVIYTILVVYNKVSS